MAAREAAAGVWLRAQQRLTERVSHEVKNALNGASVNVTAVASRVARGVAGEREAALAELAGEELARSIELVEALLAVSRPVAPGSDARSALRPLLALARAAVEADGGRLEDGGLDASGPVGAAGDTLRAAMAIALESAANVRNRTIECACRAAPRAFVVQVRTAEHSITLSESARAELDAAGVRNVDAPDVLSLHVPRAAAE